MNISRDNYYTDRVSKKNKKLVYGVIDNQPLPKEYQNYELDKRYNNHYYFLIANLLQPNVREMFSIEYLDSNSMDLILASEIEIELYRAAELVSNYQEINTL